MAAYVIVEIEVTDPVVYEEYRKVAPATIEAYGGRYIARGGRCVGLEGGWAPKRIVVLEFESVECAKEWWASEEYAGPKAMRQRSSKGRMIVVAGVEEAR